MIAYHGTSKENAASINHEGFRYGTYFAYQVEVALRFGGKYIFVVEFSDDPSMWHGEANIPADRWQFWTREHIPCSAIIGGWNE